MLKAVEKKRAYEDIVRQIRTLIEKGKLKRGDQLPVERELSETFKVSRATVREAILNLETSRRRHVRDRLQRRSTH
jgi:GntR family transcriptional repressor for pyruvate dehydrogenase complex